MSDKKIIEAYRTALNAQNSVIESLIYDWQRNLNTTTRKENHFMTSKEYDKELDNYLKHIHKCPCDRCDYPLVETGCPSCDHFHDSSYAPINNAQVKALIDIQVRLGREAIPDDIKGVMVSGVPILRTEMDKVSIQDLRLIINQLKNTKGEEK
jgi:hypothetical protein